MTNYRGVKIAALVIGDLALLYGALFATLLARYAGDRFFADIAALHIFPFTLVFALWVLLFGAFGLYDLQFMRNSRHFLYRLLRVMATNTALAIIIFYLLPFFAIEPRRNLFLIALLATITIFAWRALFNLLIMRAPAVRILFLGITTEAVELSNWLLQHPQLGQKPVAFMTLGDDPLPHPLPLPCYSRAEDIADVVRDLKIETIVILREIKEDKALVRSLFAVIPRGIAVVEFTALYEMLTGKIPVSLVGELWFLENLVGIKKRFYEFFKRLVDIAAAFFLAVPTLLLFPLIAFAIRIDSPGPIFYRQNRVGRHGKTFSLVKYRTMVKDAEKLGGFKGEGRDPRHTGVGLFLRRSYLDELPQIINILKGEMSFVGPRPERPEYVRKLKQKIPFYEMRLLVPPGTSGWAQVKMENDASVEEAPEKMQYDLYYIKNRSFVLDLLVILRTLFTVLRRQGR